MSRRDESAADEAKERYVHAARTMAARLRYAACISEKARTDPALMAQAQEAFDRAQIWAGIAAQRCDELQQVEGQQEGSGS